MSQFDCGEEPLDTWLKKRALRNEGQDSRTYVACVGQRVAAFYSLATGSVQRAHAVKKLQRNAPDPISVMVLGRLAVDVSFQKQGMGSGLLRDAILRCLQVREIAGVRAILVHAKSERAKNFYLRQGFLASPLDPLTLMVAMGELDLILAEGM